MHPAHAITLLHISDAQFGRNHRFGRLGLPEPDAPFDTLFARLCDDLRLLKDKHGLVPDLLIASGDLAEWGKKKEFDDVLALLTGLTEVLGLRRERVVIVPGNHDINRDSCAAYFMTCKANDEEPVAPYWPKWEHFHRMFRAFYGDATSVQFTPDEPWSWYEYDDLKLVVVGLNSTMAKSLLENDHHGYLGEKQLRWFADKLPAYKDEGWFRLGVMHRNYQRGVPSDNESLHDADDLRRHLAGSLNLLLHGHTHEGKVHWLDRNLPILSTGSTAVTAEARPEEVPNQYQFLRLHPNRIERYTRCYDPGQKRWIGDNRGSELGLAANPRMLGFIADLPEEQLRKARERAGEITAAALYGLLIARWLEHEQSRTEPRGALPALSLPGLREGVAQLALKLWQQAESSVRPGDARAAGAFAAHGGFPGGPGRGTGGRAARLGAHRLRCRRGRG